MKSQKKQIFLDNLAKSHGIICSACERTGISRQTYYDWISKDESFCQEVRDINERTADIVEGYLLELIQQKNASAIFFYLSRKCRGRGWGDKMETVISGTSNQDISFKFLTVNAVKEWLKDTPEDKTNKDQLQVTFVDAPTQEQIRQFDEFDPSDGIIGVEAPLPALAKTVDTAISSDTWTEEANGHSVYKKRRANGDVISRFDRPWRDSDG